MKKALILIPLVLTPLFALANNAPSVSFADLGGEPRILPSSSFYFIKEVARGIELFFAFTNERKVNLEIDFTKERLAEIKKLSKDHPDDIASLERAEERYKAHLEDLTARFANLSENTNADRLIQKLDDIATKHAAVLREVIARANSRDAKLDALNDSLLAVLEEAAKINADKAKAGLDILRNFSKEKTGDQLKDENIKPEDINDAINELKKLDTEKLEKIPEELRKDATIHQTLEKTEAAPTPINTTASPNAIKIETKIANFAFEKETHVPLGSTVIWTNTDSVGHTVTSDSDAFRSGILFSDASFSFTFKEKGSFPYHCEPHPWMRGVVIVE